jgi:hypothetical protein
MELSSCRDFGLRSFEVLVLLVLRIHDFPNPDASMDSPLSRLFPSPRIYAMRPRKMDGPCCFASSRLATLNFSNNLKPQLPKCRRFPQCSPRVQTKERLRSYRYFRNRDFASFTVECLLSTRPPISRTLKCRWSNGLDLLPPVC